MSQTPHTVDATAVDTRARHRLREWFDQPLGRSVQAIEANALRSIWPHLYGTRALQLGHVGHMDLLDACLAPSRYILDQPGFHGASLASPVHADVHALPFEGRSIDVVLLPHTLEFARDPHQVLREAQRVLAPEGYIVLLGFNPLSLWGLWRLLRRRTGRAPWCGNFLHLYRVKDWLKLLDFELVQGKMIYYRPPVGNETLRDRLYFLDQIGDRWWPMAAAVYLVVAKKRVVAMTPLRPAWRERRLLGNSLAYPAGRVVQMRRDQVDGK
jgi:SAM-dependent methyltransferase